MKYTILCLTVLTVLSCSKNDNITPMTASTTSVTPKMRGANTGLNAWDIAANEPCYPITQNCVILPDVVITPSQYAALSVAAASGPKIVGETFLSSGFANIYGNLADGLGDKLASEEYYIKEAYSNEDFVKYYVGTASQLAFDNKEFTMQFALR